MEDYLYYGGIAIVLNILGIRTILIIILIKILHPNATLKETENIIKNTKSKFPKLWK